MLVWLGEARVDGCTNDTDWRVRAKRDAPLTIREKDIMALEFFGCALLRLLFSRYFTSTEYLRARLRVAVNGSVDFIKGAPADNSIFGVDG